MPPDELGSTPPKPLDFDTAVVWSATTEVVAATLIFVFDPCNVRPWEVPRPSFSPAADVLAVVEESPPGLSPVREEVEEEEEEVVVVEVARERGFSPVAEVVVILVAAGVAVAEPSCRPKTQQRHTI